MSRVPPPSLRPAAPILIGPPLSNDWLTAEANFAFGDHPPLPCNTYLVELGLFARANILFAIACLRGPKETVRAQCRFLGVRSPPAFPMFFREAAAARALELVAAAVATGGRALGGVEYFLARTGRRAVFNRLVS